MPPELVALTEGPNILLDKPILLLGRHQECDIQLGSRKVSRRHCCLAQVNDYLVVRDLGSTNGIRINGLRVVEGSLRPGDELTIGNQRFQLQWQSKALRATPPTAHGPKPAAPPAVDDANLESSDNPVPLPEPEMLAPLAPAIPVAAPLAAPINGFGAAHEPQASKIVPDDLKLRPLSSEQPPPV
jgi:pSer/pThr/pTyr-binding forkhead associated (FHA) protein